jgi:hypothetical protein
VIADPGEGQIGERLVAVGQIVEGDGFARRRDRALAAQDHALGASGRSGGVEDDGRIGPLAGVDAPVEVGRRGRIGEGGAAFRHERLERVKAGLVVVGEAARLVVNEMAQPRQPAADREDLVDLLLVLGDDDAGLGVIEHRGDLVRHRIGVDGDGDGADHLRRSDRPVKLRTVRADDRDGVAAIEAEGDEAHGDGARLVVDLGPGPRLPEAEILVAEGGTGASHGGMRSQKLGESVARVASHARRAQTVPPTVAPVAFPLRERAFRPTSHGVALLGGRELFNSRVTKTTAHGSSEKGAQKSPSSRRKSAGTKRVDRRL